MRPLQRQLACRVLFDTQLLFDAQLSHNAQLLFDGQVYQTRAAPRSAVLGEKIHYFNRLLRNRKFEGTALAKRQISQEWQIKAGRAGELIVDGVRMLIGAVGQLEQGQGEIGGNREVEFGFT